LQGVVGVELRVEVFGLDDSVLPIADVGGCRDSLVDEEAGTGSEGKRLDGSRGSA